MTTKQKIQAVLERLPENSSYEQVIEEICLLAKIEEGLDDLARGKSHSDEEVWKIVLGEN